MARPKGMRKCNLCNKFFPLGEYVSKATCECNVLTLCKTCTTESQTNEGNNELSFRLSEMLNSVDHVKELHDFKRN